MDKDILVGEDLFYNSLEVDPDAIPHSFNKHAKTAFCTTVHTPYPEWRLQTKLLFVFNIPDVINHA